MKPRFLFTILLAAIALALTLVIAGTALQSNSLQINTMLNAQQKNPALIVLDLAGLLMVAVVLVMGISQNVSHTVLADHADRLQEELSTSQKQNQEAITKVQNDLLENLKALQTAQTQHAEELHALQSHTEQSLVPLKDHSDTLTRQIDAVHLALQYHRADLQQIRYRLANPAVTQAAAGAIPHEITAPLPEYTSTPSDITANAPDTTIAAPVTIELVNIQADTVPMNTAHVNFQAEQSAQQIETQPIEDQSFEEQPFVLPETNEHSKTEEEAIQQTSDAFPASPSTITQEEWLMLTKPLSLEETTPSEDFSIQYEEAAEAHTQPFLSDFLAHNDIPAAAETEIEQISEQKVDSQQNHPLAESDNNSSNTWFRKL